MKHIAGGYLNWRRTLPCTSLIYDWVEWGGVGYCESEHRSIEGFFFLLQILAALVPKLCKSYILLSELQTVFGGLILL